MTRTLRWTEGSLIRTPDHGVYALIRESVRHERPYYQLLWYPTPGALPINLGDSREQYSRDWNRAGTIKECRALAREHYAAQVATNTTPPEENAHGQPSSSSR